MKDTELALFLRWLQEIKQQQLTEEQVREVIYMSRQTKEVDGIRFPIPKYTEQEIIDTINQQ